MCYKTNNQEIGDYISGLIEREFKSARQFCIEYLQLHDEKEPSPDDINNMANRLSQIKKGAKSIQIYDLPIFSKLLHVSVEQILSAGKSGEPKNDRMTNYTIAQSHNKAEWTAYIEDKSNAILNPDEYGKTVLEYAIMFGNYDFIKFLVSENYIWFDNREGNYWSNTFGAGTNIHRLKYVEDDNRIFVYRPEWNDLQAKLATEDQLRMYIISFAADYNDISMLHKLKAREIPEFYRVSWSFAWPDFEEHYDKVILSHIAKSSDKVLDYFTDFFEIEGNDKNKDGSKRKYIFLFPYISQLLDMMIENNSPFLKKALEKSIKHNESTREKLELLIKETIKKGHNNEDTWKEDIAICEEMNIIRFWNLYSMIGIVTNIARTTKESKDSQINELIKKLNNLYDSIMHITEEKIT